MEVKYVLRKYNLLDGLIGTHCGVDKENEIICFCFLKVPNYNVASIEHSACVLEGVSRSRNALINGDFKNYDWVCTVSLHFYLKFIYFLF